MKPVQQQKKVQELGTVQDQFPSFIEFERAWHEWVATTKMKDNELYQDGQFDEIPYVIWDKNYTDWRTF